MTAECNEGSAKSLTKTEEKILCEYKSSPNTAKSWFMTRK